MKKKRLSTPPKFRIVCTTCGETIREKANNESSGQCLKCSYRAWTAWLRVQPRTTANEFVSDR